MKELMEPSDKESVSEAAELEREFGELFERTLRLELELEAIVSERV